MKIKAYNGGVNESILWKREEKNLSHRKCIDPS
jgi:hypothetical protein